MAQIRYTDEELEQAKDFLRRRIESELSMHRDVEDVLTEYAEKLLDLLFRDATQDEIDVLVDEMCAQLLSDCFILGVDDRQDDREAILLWMNSERNGDTLEGRIDKRGQTWLNEIFAVYAAGKLLGLDRGSLLSSIKANMKHPWDNEVLVAVREKIRRGEVSGNIEDFEEPHFGTGHEISSMGALQTITGFAISDAWMWWQYEDARKQGARGYFVERGSNFPCEECDSHTGVFFPIGDEDNRPQYHRNCCCIVIYTYVDHI